jgi:hypothetical protein
MATVRLMASTPPVRPKFRVLLLAAKIELARLGVTWSITDWTAMQWLFAGRPDPATWRPYAPRTGRPQDQDSRGSEFLPEHGCTRSQLYLSRKRQAHQGMRLQRLETEVTQLIQDDLRQIMGWIESGVMLRGSDDLESELKRFLT